jgi:signal transduction histidine kinase
MNSTRRTIFIICADLDVRQGCINELTASGGSYLSPTAVSVEQARHRFLRTPPTVIFLDESALNPARDGEGLEPAVAQLIETAPVVVAASAKKQSELSFLITSGAVDFVIRSNHFLPTVAELLQRRVRMSDRAAGMIPFPKENATDDFGEILRHEVNNPLTGILGNTELLLAQRDRLPPAVVERLQTIAELAVRLRETVRRVSNAWDENHQHARPA